MLVGEGNGNPLQYSCLDNSMDGGAWWAAVYGVAQSRTWLKWLSSSSMLVLDWSPSPFAGNSGKLQPPRLGLASPLAQHRNSVQRATPKRKGRTNLFQSLIRLWWWEILGAPTKDKCVSQIKGTSVISRKHLLPSISSRDVNNKEVYHLMGEVRGWVEIRTTMATRDPDSFCLFSICGFGLQVWTIRIKKQG